MRVSNEKLRELISKNFNVNIADDKELESFSEDYEDEVEKNGGRARNQSRIAGLIESVGAIRRTIESLIEPWAKVDKAASHYANTIGMTAAAMEKMRKQSIDFVQDRKIAINYNMSAAELIEAQEKYIKGIGRNIRLDEDAKEQMAAISKVMGDGGIEMASLFENFGVSMETTGEHIGRMWNEATRKGISLEKYSQNVTNNIKLAQNYTFKNGLKGLESMAQKATAIKLDMAQVASFAEKVGSVEGALETAAKLQVLGGPFAQMADPLGMLNESLTNMEGLSDRLIKMVSSLGNFNKTTGEVVVSPFNKRRIKAAAEAMGVDYSSIMETVNAQAKRKEIARQIKSSAVASGFDKDMKELLMNSGVIKNGKAGISIDGEFKTLDQLKGITYDELVKETQSQEQDIKEIAKMLRSHYDKREGFDKQVENRLAKMFGWLGEAMGNIYHFLGNSNIALWIIAAAQGAQLIKGGINTIRNSGLFARGARGAASGGAMKSAGPVSNKILGKKAAGTVTNAELKTMGKGWINSGGKRVVGEKIVLNNGKKYILKEGTMYGAKGAVNGAARDVVMKQFAKETGQVVGTKTATGIGANLAGKALAGGGVGTVLGIGGAIGNASIDSRVASGKIEKGGARHTAGKVGYTALEGAGWGILGGTIASSVSTAAAAGTSVGPIGTVIGAAAGLIAGAVVGGIKMAKIKREMALDNQLAEYGITRKGNYGAYKLKRILKGLETGEISSSIRRDLQRNGDFEILKKIDEAKEKREEKEGKVKGKISQATFTVENAIFNGGGFGRPTRKTRGLAEKDANWKSILDTIGYNIINPVAGSIDATNDLITAISETGSYKGTQEMIDRANEKNKVEQQVTVEPIKLEPQKIEITINGTIKLEGPNGKQVDISDELIDNDTFKSKLAREIVNKYGYIIKSQANRTDRK